MIFFNSIVFSFTNSAGLNIVDVQHTNIFAPHFIISGKVSGVTHQSISISISG
ncbi:MAG: hypothetical protein LBQ59_00755 [Candidatus Peribacteria bacterium]|jgi:hypothetical protein|nr:hypothetical protein [Candidatus Peribacteria bacterium]